MKKAESHSRGWTRRQKDILAFAATIALSAFILSGGFMASAWMEKLVPSFIDRTVYTDKTDVAGPVFSHNDNIRTFLTPWNLYDANHMRPISEKETNILANWGNMDMFIEALLPASLNGRSLLDKFVVSDEINTDEGLVSCFFLKDEKVILSNNQTVFIDCSIQSAINSSSLYFYYRPEGEEDSVPTEILDSAYQKLQQMLTPYVSIYNNGELSEYSKEWDVKAAHVAEAIGKCINTEIRVILDNYFYSEKLFSYYEILRTDTELLLVFSLDERIRMIYFIEPRNLQFRGFSIQM